MERIGNFDLYKNTVPPRHRHDPARFYDEANELDRRGNLEHQSSASCGAAPLRRSSPAAHSPVTHSGTVRPDGCRRRCKVPGGENLARFFDRFDWCAAGCDRAGHLERFRTGSDIRADGPACNDGLIRKSRGEFGRAHAAEMRDAISRARAQTSHASAKMRCRLSPEDSLMTGTMRRRLMALATVARKSAGFRAEI